jgi:uncharacterized membrane protein
MKFTLRHLLLALSSFSVFSIVAIGENKPAYGWFDVCNRSTQTVRVAFAYLDVDSATRDVFGLSIPQAERGWVSEGWWKLTSGECARVYPHELRKRNTLYYVHAKGNTVSWGRNHNFCVTDNKFTLGVADKRCGANGRWQGFTEVSTGNSRNYTFNLTE